MKRIVALAALLTAAPLLAWSSPPASPPVWSGDRPPARFQGTGLAPVLFVPPELIQRVCGVIPPEGFVVIACVRKGRVDGKEMSVIVMPDPCAFVGDPYAEIACHENGHYFKGWKHEAE